MADGIPIKEVPVSPNTSWDLIWVYNPLTEDFTHQHDSKSYTIKGKGKKQFPEFLGRHLAKHLAKHICLKNHEKEVIDEMNRAQGAGHPYEALAMKSMPLGRKDEMLKWILNPVGVSPETTEAVPKYEYITQEELEERQARGEKVEFQEGKIEIEEPEPTPVVMPEPEPEKQEPSKEGFVCDICKKSCKSKAGVAAHKRFSH